MYYKKHAFFCTNKKADGTGCGSLISESSINIAKINLQTLDSWGEGKVRISRAGCLGRCAEGPACVVYPDNVWYSYVDEDDIEEITKSHLISDQPVERLKI